MARKRARNGIRAASFQIVKSLHSGFTTAISVEKRGGDGGAGEDEKSIQKVGIRARPGATVSQKSEIKYTEYAFNHDLNKRINGAIADGFVELGWSLVIHPGNGCSVNKDALAGLALIGVKTVIGAWDEGMVIAARAGQLIGSSEDHAWRPRRRREASAIWVRVSVTFDLPSIKPNSATSGAMV